MIQDIIIPHFVTMRVLNLAITIITAVYEQSSPYITNIHYATIFSYYRNTENAIIRKRFIHIFIDKSFRKDFVVLHLID